MPARPLILCMLLLLAACGQTQVLRGGIEVPSASAQYAGATDPSDPLERLNRGLMDAQMALDDSVFRPIAETYRAALPEYGRARVRLALRNLGEPVIFAHNILQLRFDAAGTTLGRFALNSTLGLGGMFDIASDQGLPRQTGDFGQTFARYGVGDGPYLFLPVLGPTVLRDAVGDGLDGFFNPVSIALDPMTSRATLRFLNITRSTLGGVDLRAENLDTLDALRADSIDFYARLRSVTRQRREAELAVVRGSTPRERRDDPESTVVVMDDPGAPAAPVTPAAAGSPQLLVLDDPGSASVAAAPASPVVAPLARQAPRVPPAWVGGVLRDAALDRPSGPAEPLPSPARADARWAGQALDDARLR